MTLRDIFVRGANFFGLEFGYELIPQVIPSRRRTQQFFCQRICIPTVNIVELQAKDLLPLLPVPWVLVELIECGSQLPHSISGDSWWKD